MEDQSSYIDKIRERFENASPMEKVFLTNDISDNIFKQNITPFEMINLQLTSKLFYDSVRASKHFISLGDWRQRNESVTIYFSKSNDSNEWKNWGYTEEDPSFFNDDLIDFLSLWAIIKEKHCKNIERRFKLHLSFMATEETTQINEITPLTKHINDLLKYFGYVKLLTLKYAVDTMSGNMNNLLTNLKSNSVTKIIGLRWGQIYSLISSNEVTSQDFMKHVPNLKSVVISVSDSNFETFIDMPINEMIKFCEMFISNASFTTHILIEVRSRCFFMKDAPNWNYFKEALAKSDTILSIDQHQQFDDPLQLYSQIPNIHKLTLNKLEGRDFHLPSNLDYGSLISIKEMQISIDGFKKHELGDVINFFKMSSKLPNLESLRFNVKFANTADIIEAILKLIPSFPAQIKTFKLRCPLSQDIRIPAAISSKLPNLETLVIHPFDGLNEKEYFSSFKSLKYLVHLCEHQIKFNYPERLEILVITGCHIKSEAIPDCICDAENKPKFAFYYKFDRQGFGYYKVFYNDPLVFKKVHKMIFT
uniref:F-box domain-containing protein n=1 Tax=Rhabditophanes sp. KR3021 TaxID=114890 RepID=A0AC35UB06_9BILA